LLFNPTIVNEKTTDADVGLYLNRNLCLHISRAPLKIEAQGTRLFTSTGGSEMCDKV